MIDMAAAVEELHRRLLDREPLRCMGCGTLRRWPPADLHVVGYMPREPAHWPVTYLACTACLQSPERRARLVRWAETASRDAAEGAI